MPGGCPAAVHTCALPLGAPPGGQVNDRTRPDRSRQYGRLMPGRHDHSFHMRPTPFTRRILPIALLATLAAVVASCGGPPKLRATSSRNAVVVSYGGVSITFPRGWRAFNRPAPICGATPRAQTVYAWKVPPGPSPSCARVAASVPYATMACPSQVTTESSTSTTVLGGLNVILSEDRFSPGIVILSPPSGHPAVYISTPLQPPLARKIALTTRAVSGSC